MSDPTEADPTAPFMSLLKALRTLPLWLFGGLAVAGYALLYLPAFGGVDPTAFRKDCGVWLWVGTVVFTILAIARASDLIARHIQQSIKEREQRHALRFVPRLQQCWWRLAKQRDDSFISQLSIDVDVTNVTDRPVKIVKAQLVRPRGVPIVHALVSLPMKDSPYYSEDHPVPPYGTETASCRIKARDKLAKQGKPLRITLGFTDQFGDEYLVKRVIIPSRDRSLSQLGFRGWVRKIAGSIVHIARKSPEAVEKARPLPVEWNHRGRFEAVDLILNEERRNYAANGRECGGIGSLNVRLQSELNYGQAEAGKIPRLLWERAQRKILSSDNLERLIRLSAEYRSTDRKELEIYLKRHLDRRSQYADVAYFIFLALHRFNQTENALVTARTNLSGDKQFGYSNLLGLLSALVSHEYEAIEDDLLANITKALQDDTEPNFRLLEKLTLARLRKSDSVSSSPTTGTP